jgi:hypothetical protein
MYSLCAEHSGYIWRKENFLDLGRTRFWGIVYRGRLYLYKTPQDALKRYNNGAELNVF